MMPPPPANYDPQLVQYFWSVDADGSGEIDVSELHLALRRAGINLELNACAMLIRLHDVDRNGQIGLDEFVSLHTFIRSVQYSFWQFDQNRNGTLDRDELLNALRLNNFNLHRRAFDAVFESFDPQRRNCLTQSDYIAMAAFLTYSRNIFEQYDSRRDGFASFNFNNFCCVMSYLR